MEFDIFKVVFALQIANTHLISPKHKRPIGEKNVSIFQLDRTHAKT